MSGPTWTPDDFIQTFVSDDFDVEAHASNILREGTMNDEVSRLGAALADLDCSINTHVCEHYTDLLSHAVASEQLEATLTVMSTHIQSLQLSTDRLRARVAEPYDKIQSGTVHLGRLQQTCDILRRVIRILQLSKRLQGQMAGSADLTKAASSLAELGELLQEDLSGLEVVEGEARLARQWRAEVERQGEALLTRGMETGNQAQLGTGLQVFYNLGTLAKVTDNLLDTSHAQLRQMFQDGLDIKRISSTAEEVRGTAVTKAGPGRAAMPGPGNMAAFRATLWTNVDQLLEAVHTHVARVIHLQRILGKKQDPVSHVAYLAVLSAEGRDTSIAAMSWRKVTDIVTTALTNAAAKSNFVKQALEGEYPKLVRLYCELWGRLRATAQQYNTVTVMQPDDAIVIEDPFTLTTMSEKLRESLSQFEHAYLARSLSRLFDPVNLMFSGGSVPSQDEVSQVFSTFTSELGIAKVEPRLAAAVNKNIVKTIQLFCVKCEQSVKADADASQVIGYPTEAQKRNVKVVNILAEFSIGLERLVEDHSSLEHSDNLSQASTSVTVQMEAAIQPLLASVDDAVEAIVLTMHNEDFSMDGEAGTPAAACSLYMKELQTFLARISTDFLAQFTCKDFLAKQLQPLAERCIRRFVLHSSLVRPMGAGGAMRLASDCAQLEFALSTILGPTGHTAVGPTGLTALGPAYRLLRALRSLLFLTPVDMSNYQGLGTVVPYSVVLHLLFSRSPSALASPHATVGWGVARYSQWLEDHEMEKDRLQLIQGSLEAYVAGARSRQDKAYVPQYPVLLDVLQRGLVANQ